MLQRFQHVQTNPSYSTLATHVLKTYHVLEITPRIRVENENDAYMVSSRVSLRVGRTLQHLLRLLIPAGQDPSDAAATEGIEGAVAVTAHHH